MSGARAEARVYLVDDNDGFRDSTAWLLGTAGFEVAAFASGPEFVEAYGGDRHGAEPECLVSDMRMPQMSGLQLQDELRRRGIVLPLVFVTAHGDVPLAVEAMRKGAANFLEKPFGEDALVRSEEHTSELQSLMRISYAVFCLKKKNKAINKNS